MADQEEYEELKKRFEMLLNFRKYFIKNSDEFDPNITTPSKQWLGRIMRLKITDGRILVGFFRCTDREVNILLTNCKSYWEKKGRLYAQYLGTGMVPSKHIVSICVDQPLKK